MSLTKFDEWTDSIKYENEYSIKYNDGIFCVSWSLNGMYLAIGCADGIIRILDGINGKFFLPWSKNNIVCLFHV